MAAGAKQPPAKRSRSLKIHGRGLASLIGLQFVRYALIFLKGAHTGTLDRRDMHECILAATVRRDKAIALVGVKKFHSSGSHMGILYPKYDGHAPTATHPGFNSARKG